MPYEKRKSSTRLRKPNIPHMSWDPTTSLDILMDDSSPPSSVTSSNYITRSNDEATTTTDDKEFAENSWVSSTTKGSLRNINDIKREPEYVNSSSLDVCETANNYNPPPLMNGVVFDEEESLEELDDDEAQSCSSGGAFRQITSVYSDVKPNDIYLAKGTKPHMPSSINKIVTLGGKVASSIKTEAAHLGSMTYSKDSINAIELPTVSSGRAILKLPNTSRFS